MRSLFLLIGLLAAAVTIVSQATRAADVTKANNTDALALGSSWVGGSIPTSGDTIVWDSTVTAANTVPQGGDLSVQGIRIENPGGLVRIEGDAAQTLTVGAGGIDLSTATQNLNLAQDSTLAVRLALGANQTWDVAGNRLITSGNTNGLGVLVANNGHTLTVDGGGGVFLGSYAGSGGLTVQGGSTLQLRDGGLFDYSGGLTITGSTLSIRGIFSQLGEKPLGSGSLTVHDATLNLIVGNSAYTHGNAVAMSGNLSIANSSISGGTPGRDQTFGTLSISGSGTLAVTATGTNDPSIIFGAATLAGSPTFDVGSRAGNALRLGAVGESGGTRSITKTGIGTLRLTGASSYTGTTTISAGILALTGAGSLPAAAGVSNAGTLDISGITPSGTTIGSLAGAGSVVLGGKTLTLGDATSTVVDGVISGVGGSLVKQGSGTLTLSGTNSFDGTLTATAGTLAIATITDAGVAGPLGAGSAAVVLGGSGSTGTLSFTGATAASTRPFTAASGGTAAFSVANAGTTLTLSGLVDGVGDKSFDGAGSLVAAGAISGGNVFKSGTGTLTLAGLNGQADTTVNDGQLNINQFAALGISTGTLTLATGITLDNTSNASVTVTNPKSIALGSSLAFLGTNDLDLGEGTTTLSATTTFDIAAGTLTLSGDVLGTGFGIVKNGTGTLRLDGLSGTSSFTGNSTVNAGTLLLEGASQLGGGSTTVVTLGENGFLQVGASASLNNVTIAGFTGNVISASVINANQTFTQSEILASVNANYNGIQTIAAGVTVTTAANYLGTIPASATPGRIVLENGATLAASAGFSIDPRQGVSLAAGTATLSVVAGQAVFMESAIAGAGGLRKTGAGNVRLTGANTYQGGTLIEQGILGISSGAALGDVGGGLTIDGAILAAATNPDGSGTGATIDSARSVLIGNSKTSGLHAQNGLTLRYDGAIAEIDAQGAAGSLQFGLAGPREGTVILGGANTYRGDTILSAGTLKLGSGGSLASSPRIIVGDAGGSSAAVLDLSEKTTFSIGATQTLEGKGTVRLGGSTSLTIDGLLSPGNSPGLLTYDGGGSVTLAGTTLMEVWGTSRGANPGYDAIDIESGTTFSLGGVLQLDFNQTFADGTTFNLFTPDGTSSLTSTFSSIAMVGSAYSDLTFTNNAGLWTTTIGAANQSMSFDSSTGNLAILVVPEPASVAILVAAACGGLALRRRTPIPTTP